MLIHGWKSSCCYSDDIAAYRTLIWTVICALYMGYEIARAFQNFDTACKGNKIVVGESLVLTGGIIIYLLQEALSSIHSEAV